MSEDNSLSSLNEEADKSDQSNEGTNAEDQEQSALFNLFCDPSKPPTYAQVKQLFLDYPETDVNYEKIEGQGSAITYAISTGCIKTIRLLLKRGSVLFQDPQFFVLDHAFTQQEFEDICRAGVEMLKVYLEYGYDPNWPDGWNDEQSNGLMIAAENGEVEIVKYLLLHCNPCIEVTAENNYEQTALDLVNHRLAHHELESEQLLQVKWLLEHWEQMHRETCFAWLALTARTQNGLRIRLPSHLLSRIFNSMFEPEINWTFSNHVEDAITLEIEWSTDPAYLCALLKGEDKYAQKEAAVRVHELASLSQYHDRFTLEILKALADSLGYLHTAPQRDLFEALQYLTFHDHAISVKSQLLDYRIAEHCISALDSENADVSLRVIMNLVDRYQKGIDRFKETSLVSRMLEMLFHAEPLCRLAAEILNNLVWNNNHALKRQIVKADGVNRLAQVYHTTFLMEFKRSVATCLHRIRQDKEFEALVKRAVDKVDLDESWKYGDDE